MSENIFDEALKESKDFGSMIGLKLDKVNKALELGKLYKKLSYAYKTRFDTTNGEHVVVECWEKIKELENERN